MFLQENGTSKYIDLAQGKYKPYYSFPSFNSYFFKAIIIRYIGTGFFQFICYS